MYALEFLLLHLCSTEIKVHEMAFSRSQQDTSSSELLRTESLCTILEATKKWFDIYFTFPPAYYVRFSMSVSTQLAQCIVMLYRLSTFDHPGWDRGHVRQTCNLSIVLDELVNNAEQVQSAAGLDYDDEWSHMKLFNAKFRKLTTLKEWWQAKESVQDPSVPAVAPAPPEAMRGVPVDPWGDTWLNDMLMMGDFQFEPYNYPYNSSI